MPSFLDGFFSDMESVLLLAFAFARRSLSLLPTAAKKETEDYSCFGC